MIKTFPEYDYHRFLYEAHPATLPLPRDERIASMARSTTVCIASTILKANTGVPFSEPFRP